MASVKDDSILLPPDERFWKRYSPHHEALLSGFGSLTLHALVIGFMLLLGVLAVWARSDETHRPPNMDVIQLSGDGSGFEGGGAPAGLGTANADTKEEAVAKQPATETKPQELSTKIQLKPVPITSLSPDLTADDPETKTDVDALLTALGKEAQKIGEEAPKDVQRPRNTATPGDPRGKPGGKGPGGKGGTGAGTGRGNKTGPGIGGPGGKATNQEIHAQRWDLNLLEERQQTSNGKLHAQKLDAAGVILIVVHPQRGALIIRDLKRRPVEPKAENLAPFKDAVTWINKLPESIIPLANELGLGFQPRFVAVILPRDREQAMANAEADYARRIGRSLDSIRKTYFDFRLRGGTYEPVVLDIE